MSMPADTTALGFILTRDRARAKAFYSGTMGFALLAEDDFAATYDMAGLAVRLTDVADHRPSPHSVLGWNVPDILAVSAGLAARGVAFQHHPGLTEGPFGIWTAPDGRTRVNWFADPDGNVLSLTQTA